MPDLAWLSDVSDVLICVDCRFLLPLDVRRKHSFELIEIESCMSAVIEGCVECATEASKSFVGRGEVNADAACGCPILRRSL